MRNPANVLTLLTSLLGAAGCLAATSPAAAQQTRPGEVMGMRYLSWSGKAEAPVDGLRRSALPAPIAIAAADSQYSAHQTASRPSRYGAGSGGLTPASVWTGAQRSPLPNVATAPTTSAPQVAAQPDHAAEDRARAEYKAQVQSEYQAWYQSEAQAQYEAQVRALPQQQQQIAHVAAAAQPAPVQQQAEPQPQQQASVGSPPGYDPMAPRRDAPIFHMQQPGQEASTQPAPQPEQADQQVAPIPGEIQQPVLTQPTAGRTYSGQAYAGAEPPRESARYYSVHRAGGHQPDPITMPVSVYLDNAPIDLAEPPAAPVPTRTVNGRTQLIVANQDPALP